MGCTNSVPKAPKTSASIPKAATKNTSNNNNGIKKESKSSPPKPHEAEEDPEQSAHKTLQEEKKQLHSKAIEVMLDRRYSISMENLDSIDTGGGMSNSEADHMKGVKYQQQQRRKSAKIAAERNHKWMLFSNNNDFEEADINTLAVFMETAMKRVPELRQYEIPSSLLTSNDLKILKASTFVTDQQDDSDKISPRASGDNVITASRDNSIEKLVRLDRIAAEHVLDEPKAQEAKIELASSDNEDSIEYDLPSGPVTPGIAYSVFEIMKNGSRLSVRALQKLLRHTYNHLCKAPTLNRITITSKEKLTVVGDIHGQLADLLHIISDSGFPTATHKFIFNGDFIDRGDFGVEVMCVLMSLYLAFPHSVYFNRGNHEDFAICSAYGFQQECLSKYDDVCFGMFIEIFNYLPMYTLVNDAVLILHGGLFHALDVKIKDFDKIQRHEYSLLDMPQGGEDIEPIPRSDEANFYKQLQRDTLWSDPKDSLGNDYNSRGAGVAFGPDVTKQFLDSNNLKMIIRSHECVRSGYDRPYLEWPEYENLLCTLFSASNYSNSGNTAAYIEITTSDSPNVNKIASSMLFKVSESNLVYTVHFYHVGGDLMIDDSGLYSNGEEDEDDNTVVDLEILASKAGVIESGDKGTDPSPEQSTDSTLPNGNDIVTMGSATSSPTNSSPLTIPQQIYRKRNVLQDAFLSADMDKDGVLPLPLWSDVMQHILRLNINWISLLPTLIRLTQPDVVIDMNTFPEPDKNGLVNGNNICLTLDEDGERAINYNQFLNSFSATTKNFDSEEIALSLGTGIIEDLYSHYVDLENVFKFFDEDGDGVIRYAEFARQCDAMNKALSPEYRLSDELLGSVYQLMDVKECGEVDINLFFEMFRLADGYAKISDKVANYKNSRERRSGSIQAPALRRGRSLSAQFKESPSEAITILTLPNSPISASFKRDNLPGSNSISKDLSRSPSLSDTSKFKGNDSKSKIGKSNSLSSSNNGIFLETFSSDDSIFNKSPTSSPRDMSPKYSSETVDIKGVKISIDAASPPKASKNLPTVSIDI